MSGPWSGYLPFGADPFIMQARLAALLGSHFDEEQRVWILGFRDIGGDESVIRFRAARACAFVRVHVQSDAALGGGPFYNPEAFINSTQYDMRENRQRDVTIERNGTDRYYVWLVPEFLNPDGSFTRYNGLGASIVDNGGFDTDTLWSKGTGWTIAAGVATKVPPVVGAVSQGAVVAAGATYWFYFTIATYSAGSLTPDVGNSAGVAVSAAGAFAQSIVAGALQVAFLTADAAFDGSVDNVGVYLYTEAMDHMAFMDLGI